MNLYQLINKKVNRYDLVDQEYANKTYLKKIWPSKYFYLGGANASDSNNGETPDKPFASFGDTIYHLSNTVTGGNATLILQDDVTIEKHFDISVVPGGSLTIVSDDTKRTIRCVGNAFVGINQISAGKIVFKNVNICVDQAYFIHGMDSAMPMTVLFLDTTFTSTENTSPSPILHNPGANCVYVFSGNTEFLNCNCQSAISAFNGGTAVFAYSTRVKYTNCTFTRSNLRAANGGKICANYDVTFTGDVTGKRYEAVFGSKILVYGLGPNIIPGSEDGVCDETSIYA